MKENKKNIGILAERIYLSRKALNMTQEMLAEKLGITPQSVSRWENGQSRPDVDMLPRLAAFFGITIDALFGYKAENLKIAHYEKTNSNRNKHWRRETDKLALEVVGLLQPIEPKNILVAGCDEGETAVFFARNGYIVSAFDVNADSLTEGRKLAEEVGVDVNFFCADILTYKIEKNFDIIYLSGIMQTIPPKERQNILEMIQAHTNIGGLNVVSAFVDKSFIAPASDWKDNEYLYKTAEIFGYYGSNWKFEIMQEVYFDGDSGATPHRHCMDVLVARKMK